MQNDKNRAALIFGLVLLLVGLAGLYVFGYMPWRDALNHEPKVSLSFKMLVIVPLFVVLGIGALMPLRPLPAVEMGATSEAKPPVPLRTKIFLGIWLLAEAAACGYYFWLRTFMQSQGYDV